MHGDEDEAIAALLHDVVEDGGGPRALADIERRFGADVAAIVLANSDVVEPDDERGGGRAWYERKRAYIAAFPEKSPAALRVSLADKLHNARSILLDYRTHGDALWARFRQGQGIATRIYYRELALAFERERGRLGRAGRALRGRAAPRRRRDHGARRGAPGPGLAGAVRRLSASPAARAGRALERAARCRR